MEGEKQSPVNTERAHEPSLAERMKAVRKNLNIENIFKNIGEAAKIEHAVQTLERLSISPLDQASRNVIDKLTVEMDDLSRKVSDRANTSSWRLDEDFTLSDRIERLLATIEQQGKDIDQRQKSQ